MKPLFRSLQWLSCLVILIALSGCAGEMAYRDGKDLLAQGKLEEGLTRLEQATKADPENLEFRSAYLTARERTVSRLLASAQREQAAGHLDEADNLYRRVLKIDPDGGRARQGLAAIDRAVRHAKLLTEANALLAANDVDGADRKVALVLLESPENSEARGLRRQIEERAGRDQVVPPSLRITLKKPISLEFRDATFKQVIEALSRHSGLNFVLDKDLPPNLATTVILRQVTVEDALDVILTTHQLDKRILNETTLLVFPNTAAKQSENQDLIVKSFYLANAGAKQVTEMLKAVLKVKNVFMDEKLNLVILRDTPSAVRLAERLVSIQDVPEPEVMLEVEILEIQRSRMMELGIKFPDQLTLTPLASTGTTLTLKDLQNVRPSTTGAAVSNLVVNLHKDIGETNILANPRIRTRNREKAEIKIGDRVPVITTTTTSTGFVSENVQYVDVGLKLNVEPTISPDNEVSIRLGLEVSSVVKEVVSKAGSLSYEIGGRNASTVLRLKDGETQILGGLINDQDVKTANRVPGLGDLPILGRLFSSQKDDTRKTELVLSITPHIVRGIAPPPHVPTEFWSGTETQLRLKPLAVASLAPVSPGAIGAPESRGSAGASAGNPVIAAGSDVAVAGETDKSPTLRWEGVGPAKPGNTVTLSLRVADSPPVVGFPLQVKYDPAVLEMIDATPGDFMAQDNAKVVFGKRIVAGSGIAFLTQNRPAGTGAKGDGELAKIQFRVLKATEGAIVTALPTIPLGLGNKPMRQTSPAMTGIAAQP